jgi:hypothetical protein
MKEALLTLVITFCSAPFLWAQSSLKTLDRSNGADISGTTIVYWTDSSSKILEYEFDTKNGSSTGINVRVKRTVVGVLSGSHNDYCWLTCPQPGELSPDISEPLLIAAGDTTQGLHLIVHYNPHGTIGVSTIRYTFFDDNNPLDSAFIILEFHSILSTGIAKLSGENYFMGVISPNPASTIVSFDYSLNNSFISPKLAIYDMLGKCIKDFDLMENNGNFKLHLADIPSGVYFCSLKAENRIIATQKLIINHTF